MTHIICSRDIYVTYQNQTEHKEGKKKKNKPILLSLDFNMICLSLTGEAHTSLK